MIQRTEVPLARRLAAPAASWNRTADVAVVGSGVAGLTAALGAHRSGLKVLIITKGSLGDGCTGLAQGGIAAALGAGDTPGSHLADTLAAGAGLCDEEAVRTLVEHGPGAVRGLAELGAGLDQASAAGASPEGWALTREGGHSRPRIVHAGGDATGREVSATVGTAVRAAGIETIEYAFALDLIQDGDGAAAGVTVALTGDDGEPVRTGAVHAPAVVLAAGGYGQVYATTSNPQVATGDGLALAVRAGAEVADVEFVQFHPTVLYAAADSGQLPLVSEAVRGEGAVLIDAAGERIMTGEHPLEDLAPRDVVSRAITRRMARAPAGVRDHVYLDARKLGEPLLLARFPTIVGTCRDRGVDPAAEPIPVAPAAHYACGGVRVDPAGRSSVPGLFAAGEVACTGVHGANRLASNSVLEGLVMGERLAAELAHHVPVGPAGHDRGSPACPSPPMEGGEVVSPVARRELTAAMSRHAGVLRDAEGLDRMANLLRRLARRPEGRADGAESTASANRAGWEAANLHTVATVLVESALLRTESRGCHVRVDHPDPAPAWLGRVVTRLDRDGLRQHFATGTRARDADVASVPAP